MGSLTEQHEDTKQQTWGVNRYRDHRYVPIDAVFVGINSKSHKYWIAGTSSATAENCGLSRWKVIAFGNQTWQWESSRNGRCQWKILHKWGNVPLVTMFDYQRVIAFTGWWYQLFLNWNRWFLFHFWEETPKTRTHSIVLGWLETSNIILICFSWVNVWLFGGKHRRY